MPPNNPKKPEPAEELLGSFASGKVRWVFVSFVVFFALLFFLGWLIRYPDIHSVQVMIRSVDQIDRYYAPVSGQIAAIPVENGQEVDSGAVLLVWKNGASWEDVLILGTLEVPRDGADIRRINGLELGVLEAQWILARSSWDEYRTELNTAQSIQLDPATRRQLALLENMETSLERRRALQTEQVQLAEEDWQRHQRLADQNTISREALAVAEANYLEKRTLAEAIESDFIQVRMQKENLEKEQLALALQDNKDLQQKKTDWEREWGLLKARQGDWVERYLVRARHGGEVLFSRPLEPLQWVEEGAPTIALKAGQGNSGWQAQGWLPAAGAGRVVEGAEVHLRLDAFPYEEYGFLEAEVAHISPLSEKGSFLVEIALPDSLITGTGRSIPVGPEMPATARIFTAKKRLLDRLWEGLKKR